MRKNTARHWLHAALDLLPVILIPVFMIYSHRHTIEGSTLTIHENKIVHYNQLVNDSFNSYNNNGLTFEPVNNYQVVINGTSTSQIGSASVGINFTNSYYNFVRDGRKYLVRFDDLPNGFYLGVSGYAITNNTSFIFSQVNSTSWYGYIRFQCEPNVSFNNFTLNLNIYDLTTMYGVGDEPSITDFETQFSYFSDYVQSEDILLENYKTTLYSDTDIMSQFTYQMYNAVDKYFNMGNVFNMNNVYQWFNANIFGGNAPISIYIVWNIVLYEFVMDLLFLLYALFMWFIDMTKRLIEKPMDSIK